ncbi:Fc.00g073310.m01.CDS01 [Cosmosporella sp. VM-42]
MRNRRDELLAARGIATAALTLPPSEAIRGGAHVQSKQQQLLRRLRDELTPERPEASTPFARERQRIGAAMAQDQLAFRMEQVVTVKASKLEPRRRNFFGVLHPIFQLMRFFLKETQLYTQVLRSFRPSIFPNVLCSYARMFELPLGEMEWRFRASGHKGLDLALSEGIAVLDRLGNYCFTGDPRVLPRTVLNPLITMESIKKGAWPFVSPEMLRFGESYGTMNTTRWPRTSDNRPILLHVAVLAFHYGKIIAVNRHSQLWFSQLGGKGIRHIKVAAQFLKEVFYHLWIPEMMLFMTYQLRRQLNRGARSGRDPSERLQRLERINAAIEAWESCHEPFSNQLSVLHVAKWLSIAGA